jgi:hypothetical protein
MHDLQTDDEDDFVGDDQDDSLSSQDSQDDLGGFTATFDMDYDEHVPPQPVSQTVSVASTQPPPRWTRFPPEKYTDTYEQWAEYDATLTGLEREANRKKFRAEQGRRGSRVLSAQFVEYLEHHRRFTRHLSILVAKMYCALGFRRFPFSHAENKEWKRRRKARGLDTKLTPVSPKAAKNRNARSQSFSNEQFKPNKRR